MTNDIIEGLAVNYVETELLSTGCLVPYSPKGSTEPCWDGHVKIYNSSSSMKKDQIRGQIRIQVKGTVKDDLSKDSINYPVDRVDLERYLHDGGVIYFVVYITKDLTRNKIYYGDWAPIKLRQMLKEMNAQGQRSFSFKEFPSSSLDKLNIFINLEQHCKMQNSFSDSPLYTIEELEKQGVLEGLSFFISSTNPKQADPISAFYDMDIYLYAMAKGCPVPLPLDESPKHILISTSIPASITIGDNIYYESITQVYSEENITFTIGKSIKIISSRKAGVENQYRFEYRNAPGIRSIIKDLGFFLDLINAKGFEINGVHMPFNSSDVSSSSFNITKAKAELDYFCKIVQVLDTFGIEEDLDLSKLKKPERQVLAKLVTAFVDRLPLRLSENSPHVFTIDIANYKIALIAMPDADSPGNYRICDFFRTELNCAFEDEEGEMQPVPQYVILRANDFLELCNIRFDVLLPSFKSIENKEIASQRANWMLLTLLEAYDKSGDSKPIILKTAKDFAEWLVDFNGEDEIHLINWLQVIKRERDFTIKEIAMLCKIIESPNSSKDLIVAAYLLLDNPTAARLHFNGLDASTQDAFQGFPISRFWDKMQVRELN